MQLSAEIFMVVTSVDFHFFVFYNKTHTWPKDKQNVDLAKKTWRKSLRNRVVRGVISQAFLLDLV